MCEFLEAYRSHFVSNELSSQDIAGVSLDRFGPFSIATRLQKLSLPTSNSVMFVKGRIVTTDIVQTGRRSTGPTDGFKYIQKSLLTTSGYAFLKLSSRCYVRFEKMNIFHPSTVGLKDNNKALRRY